MKKHEIKRYARAYKQAIARRNKLMFSLMLVMLAAFTAPAVAAGVQDNAEAPTAIMMLGGSVSLAAAGTLVIVDDVDDVSDKYVAGRQLSYTLYVMPIDNIYKTGFPKPNKYREVGQVPFKEGAVITTIECHQVLTSDSTGERGDLTTAVTNTITAIAGGNTDAALNLIENHTGMKCIVWYFECSTGIMYIMGTPCKPMVLSTFNRTDNLENRAITLTFVNNSYQQPCKYTGSLPQKESVVNPAGSAVLTIIPDNDTYLIPSGTDAAVPLTSVTGITDNDEGRIITLLGDGLDNLATIEDGAVFILSGGETWTAKKGSIISLRVVDASRLVEVSGSRVQS